MGRETISVKDTARKGGEQVTCHSKDCCPSLEETQNELLVVTATISIVTYPQPRAQPPSPALPAGRPQLAALWGALVRPPCFSSLPHPRTPFFGCLASAAGLVHFTCLTNRRVKVRGWGSRGWR